MAHASHVHYNKCSLCITIELWLLCSINGKGQRIATASNLIEKSMEIHFNHCGCCRTSTTGHVNGTVITTVYTGLPSNLDIHKSLAWYKSLCGFKQGTGQRRVIVQLSSGCFWKNEISSLLRLISPEGQYFTYGWTFCQLSSQDTRLASFQVNPEICRYICRQDAHTERERCKARWHHHNNRTNGFEHQNSLTSDNYFMAANLCNAHNERRSKFMLGS